VSGKSWKFDVLLPPAPRLAPRGLVRYFRRVMSTLHEIKAAAATLSAPERSELVAWLSEAKDVSEIRREQLRGDIQVGLDEIARGEVAPLDMAEIKRKARERWEADRRG